MEKETGLEKEIELNEKRTLKTSGLPTSGTDRLYLALQPVGLTLTVVGFAGPWVYGPVGKTQDWGWQPVWGLLLSVIALNVFIVFSITICVSYVELMLRLGRPPLEAVLKWVGAFFVLVVGVPVVAWSLLDFTERSPTPRAGDGALGWGVWVALAGLIMLVVALRLRIRKLKQTQAFI